MSRDEKNENNERHIGRNLPDGSADQKRQSRRYVFQSEGGEHFSYSPKMVITAGVAGVILSIVIGTISGYRQALSTIDEGIQNNRELNRRLDSDDWNIQNLKDVKDDHEKRIKDLEIYVNSRGRR